jgi:hypothetical protein
MPSANPRECSSRVISVGNIIRVTSAVVAVAVIMLAFPGTSAASFGYSIPKQQDQMTMNQDGSVTMVRYFEFKVDQGVTDAGTEIWAGLPTRSTRVSSVVD